MSKKTALLGLLRKREGRGKVEVENSVPLRAVTTAMALTGLAAASQEAECPLWQILLSGIGCLAGSYISYKRRNSNNFIIKLWISVGILVVAFLFFNELLYLANANIADARIPLTKLLMVLIALHCFDLPRRRDLSVSSLVGVTLMTVASTLSRDLYFAWFIGVFVILSVYMFQLDCASRSLGSVLRFKAGAPATEAEGSRFAAYPSKKLASQILNGDNLRMTLLCSAIVAVTSLVCFALLPRIHIGLQQVYFTGSLPFQPKPLAQFPSLSGVTAIMGPGKAYSGFTESLDTNYRGDLTDEIVLRVAGNNGTYLRGMAFDTFDGKNWSMSHPKDLDSYTAGPGSSFQLEMESGATSSHMRFKNISQEIFVEEDCSNLVLCASVPYQIYFPASSLDVDDYGSVRSPAGMKKDMVYTVFSRIPLFNYAAMRRRRDATAAERSEIASNYADFLQLPPCLSPELSRISSKVARNGNDFVQAEHLCKYLQTHFKYDLNAEPSPSGLDTVSDFVLHKKRGACEAFASALVVMCRQRGIPAMLVTGFLPGQYNPFTGLWDVRLNEAHSWAEVYIRKTGWVSLDPTPGSLMAEQPYQEQQSVFSYLMQLLDPLWQKWKESAFAHSLFEAVQRGMSVLLQGWVSYSNYFPQLMLVAICFAAVTTAVSFGKRLNFIRHALSKFGKNADLIANSHQAVDEASREFVALNRTLKNIGVERKLSETASDLLGKVEDSLAKNGIESRDYLQRLDKFLDLYGNIRFGDGAANDLGRLREMNRELDKMTNDLSKQRNTEQIPKSSC